MPSSNNFLPPPNVIQTGNLEDVQLIMTGDRADDMTDPASGWTMEFCVGTGPTASPKLRKVTGSGILYLSSSSPPVWTISLLRVDLQATLGTGIWYWFFNRTDTNEFRVIARGLLMNLPVLSGVS
jgi:hypothetical protein